MGMNILKTEEDRIKDFIRYAGDIFAEKEVEWLQQAGYFIKPASTRFHGQNEGDLYLHSKMVAMLLEEFTKKLNLTWNRKESPRKVGLLHDVCKMDEYIKKTIKEQVFGSTENGEIVIGEIQSEEPGYSFNTKTLLKGHGDKSAILCLQNTDLTDEEVMCIRYHMGAFEGKEIWDNLRMAAGIYKNIIWTMQADLTASWILGI